MASSGPCANPALWEKALVVIVVYLSMIIVTTPLSCMILVQYFNSTVTALYLIVHISYRITDLLYSPHILRFRPQCTAMLEIS